tara:strand:- start:213 stop:1322 length:1110 start_codon:yes stop_codon:yes gene_type:complete
MIHPVFSEDARDLIQRLDRLCDSGTVKKRSHGEYTLYKYEDAPKIVGDARLARGLLVCGEEIVNLPLPKYDELVPFDPDVDAYHSRVLSTLPDPLFVQPKLDGTCIHAVWHRGAPIVHTFLSFDNSQAKAAQVILQSRKWREGLTLAFELISDDDPKTQQERTRGLHLLYGADRASGCELTREALNDLSSALDVPLVKQQTVKQKSRILEIVRGLDDVSTISKVKEGIVLVDRRGQRFKIKSHTYLRMCGLRVIPTPSWLSTTVQKCKSIDELHDTVEAVDGPLDTMLVARTLLLRLVCATKAEILRVQAICEDSTDQIRLEPDSLSRTMRFALLKTPTAYDDDKGCLDLLKLTSKSSRALPPADDSKA